MKIGKTNLGENAGHFYCWLLPATAIVMLSMQVIAKKLRRKKKETKNVMRNDEKTIPEKGHSNFESARVILMNEMKWKRLK